MQEIPLSDELRNDLMEYIVSLDERITSINTIESYRNVINRIFKHYKILDKDTSKQMLKKWNKKTKIRAVFAKMNEYFDYNDIDYSIKLPRNPRQSRHIPDIINRKELKEIIDSMKNKEEKLIVSCLFNIGAGLRISELINLKWLDISWQDWTEENKTLDVKIRKSKRNNDRIVPIPHFTLAELYQYAKDIGVLNFNGIPNDGRIFDFGSDTYKKELRLLDPDRWKYEYTLYVYDSIRHNIINKYFKILKGRHITAHSLRHSRSSELYNVYKIPIAKIQQWLGHKDITTTMIYIHLANEEDIKIMEKVGGV